MEKISVRLLVLAAAIIAPNMIGSEDKTVQVKHAEQISAEDLNATTRANEYYAYSNPEREENS